MKKAFGIALLLIASRGYTATGGTVAGTVKGPDGAPFKAAFVRVQDVNTKMTTMVLTNPQGKYFADNLTPGGYLVWATSTGFKSDPARVSDVKVEDGQTVTLNFTMQKSLVQWNQLTKYQAGMLLPDAKGKDEFLMQCMNCHGFAKIGGMRHDHEGWIDAIDIMRRTGVASIQPDVADRVAGYLAAVFGPDSDTPLSPAQLPGYAKVQREHDSFSDDSLNIVYVDYQLTGDPKDRPGTSKPDHNGNMWMEMRGGLSRLNPETGELKTWRLSPPYSRSAIHEILPTPDGSVWLTLEAENGLARFDTRTEKFDTWNDVYDGAVPPQKEPNVPWPRLRDLPGMQDGKPRSHTSVIDHQGNIWVSGRPLKKFDVKTQKFTNFSDVPDCYGIVVDQQGIVWTTEINSMEHHSLVKVDPKTNKVAKYLPPDPLTRPRRVKIDPQGNVWFADYQQGKAIRFDPKTETFKEYQMPGPMPTPYGFEVDHNGNVWYSSMYTEVIGRLDPKTGKFTEYPSPYEEKGTRDMFEDSKGRIWYGAQPYFKAGYIRLRTGDGKSVAQAR
jgi:virginiamycin B lyase